MKRLQWSKSANPRIEPISKDVVRSREERKLLMIELDDLTRKVLTFIDGVILFETMRLPSFETNKLDRENMNLLDAALKIITDSINTTAKLGEDELALTELIPPPEPGQDASIIEKWRQTAKQQTKLSVRITIMPLSG